MSKIVELTHLRHEQQFEWSISLKPESGEVTTLPGGAGGIAEPEPEPLSVIIDRLNDRYGTDWRDADRPVFDAALEDVIADESVQVQAANNTPENFGLVFPDIYTDKLLGRIDRNEKVVSASWTTTSSEQTCSRRTWPSRTPRRRSRTATLPHRRAPHRRRERAPGGQVDAAHVGGNWGGRQATRDGDAQDHRRVREQP